MPPAESPQTNTLPRSAESSAGQPRVSLGLGAEPRQDGLGVAVRRREAMLGRQAVVGGEHERRELRGEPERAGVEVGQLEAAQAEPAAVEVDEHRQLIIGRRRVVVGGRSACAAL